MAFVMAFCMGISPVASSAVYAADEPLEEVQSLPDEEDSTKTAESVAEAAHSVTAEDITKDLSDVEFDAETSLEGISYDSEKEEVSVSAIEDEDGNHYQKGQSGVFFAKYLVTPKDGSESYLISRTITVTDTEGEAHTSDNGGEKQKEDTQSEEDSEDPAPVEVTSEISDMTEEELDELEQEIAEGEVLMLSAADGLSVRSRETVHLEQGERI